MSRHKLSIDFIRTNFDKEGYTLISGTYINNKTPLYYICPDGHNHYISWNNWRTGYRCPHCSGRIKKNIEFIRSSFENCGYTLLSEYYLNNKTKLHYICPKGHHGFVRWDNWQSGQRCKVCYWEDRKLNLNEIEISLKAEGYCLLQDTYINIRNKIKCRCPAGHIIEINWSQWQAGVRCPTCANIRHAMNMVGAGNPSWKGGISFEPYCEIWKDKEYKDGIKERDGYRCLNPYCSSKKPEDLTIHHIDYNKKNCDPKNLITICRSCNSAANKDRRWHKAWYQTILYRRYNYDTYKN